MTKKITNKDITFTLTKKELNRFNQDITPFKGEIKTNSKNRVIIINPKNKNIFLPFFNIKDLRRIKVYYLFRHPKNRFSENARGNDNILLNKFKKGRHYVKLKNKRNKFRNMLYKNSGIVGILEKNSNIILNLDNEIYSSLSSYTGKENNKTLKLKDTNLKNLIEKINDQFLIKKKLEEIESRIGFESFDDYENRIFEVKVFSKFIRNNVNEIQDYKIELTDIINNASTAKKTFKKNILDSNIDLKLNDPIYEKKDHYYHLHLHNYDTDLKDYYFAEYSNLFSLKINKTIAERLFVKNKINYFKELNLTENECFIPIFNKDFNPKFNRISSSLNHSFTLENISQRGGKNKDKYSHKRFSFEFGEYSNESVSFIDKGKEYKSEELNKYGDGKITIKREYTTLGRNRGHDTIKLTLENVNNIIGSDLANLLSDGIEIFGFNNKTFKIKDVKYNTDESYPYKPEYSTFVSSLNEKKIEIWIPVAKLLEEFWNNLYEINIK
tara:strand:- start:3137 stop:4627 length:1491 start_codon:yes stop_codon:yes gene_type:complete